MQAWEEKYYEREEGREEGSTFLRMRPLFIYFPFIITYFPIPSYQSDSSSTSNIRFPGTAHILQTQLG